MAFCKLSPLPAPSIHRWLLVSLIALCLGAFCFAAEIRAAQTGNVQPADPKAQPTDPLDPSFGSATNHEPYQPQTAGSPVTTSNPESAKGIEKWLVPALGIATLIVLIFGLIFLHRKLESFSSSGNSRQHSPGSLPDFETMKRQIAKIDTMLSSQTNAVPAKSANTDNISAALSKLNEKISIFVSQKESHEASRESALRETIAAEQRAMDLKKRDFLQEEARIAGERQKLKDEELRLVRDRQNFDEQSNQQTEEAARLDQLKRDLNSQAVDLDRRQDELRKQNEQIAADLKELHDERQALSNLQQSALATSNYLDQVRREMWPAAFLTGSLSSWREKLEAKMGDLQSPARMVYLSLAKCTALSAKKDDEELPKELRELGRHAYQFFSQLELNAEEQFMTATDWTQALEPEYEGRFYFRIVKVGQLKDQNWMTFSPSTGAVTHVAGWCIQNQKRMTVQRAIVE